MLLVFLVGRALGGLEVVDLVDLHPRHEREMEQKLSAMRAVESAIRAIGFGYDIAADLRLKYCKRESDDPCLIELNYDDAQVVVLPGGPLIAGVPKSIKCDKGERMRFRSDVLSFQQMAEQFNQELFFLKDVANTKALAFDGWLITLYTGGQAIPPSWDPAALTRFIERFGTHVIVGVKMGGKDVIYIRQQHSPNLQPVEVQRKLKDMVDRRFQDVNGLYGMNSEEVLGKDKFDIREQRFRFAESSPSSSYPAKEDIMKIFKKRGGNDC